MYTGNAHISSAYPVEKEKTTVIFGSGKLQSFATVAPSKQLGEKVVYGPYSNTAAKAIVSILYLVVFFRSTSCTAMIIPIYCWRITEL